MTTTQPNSSAGRTLYLIDGHAQIFRAYFAIRGGMTSPVTGEPSHAVFGFAGMLLKFFREFKPQFVAMPIDTPGKTFRDEMYEAYKANRPSAPEDFHSQEQRIFEMTKMFGVPILGLQGVEADDVIATIVKQVLANPELADVNIRIVSRDKDLAQLLGPRVTMFDIHTDTTIDEAQLMADKGVTPAQVIDLLTLTGDTADNIPGVPGVGPKTATKLLQQFGSLDAILENLDKLTPKQRESFEKAREHLPLSRRLVALKADCDINFTLDQARMGPVDGAALRHLFKQMGFRRHTDDLDRLLGKTAEAAPAAPESRKGKAAEDDGAGTLFQTQSDESAVKLANEPADESAGGLFDSNLIDASATPLTTAKDCHYEAILTQQQLDDLVATLRTQSLIAIDTETVGLGLRARLCGICIAWMEKHGVYIPTISQEQDKHLNTEQVLAALKEILENPAIHKTGHNIKYDLQILTQAGATVNGVVFDSMIAAHLLGLPGIGMDHLALSLLHHETIPITDLIGLPGRGRQQLTMDQVDLKPITTYAAEDADITLRLYHDLKPKLEAKGMMKLMDEVETPLISVLAHMERAGITVNPEELMAQKLTLAARIVELREQVQTAAGVKFNPDSPKQLADVLFNQLKLPVIKRNKTGPSTDVEVLEKLAAMDDLPPEQARVPNLIVEYRQLSKLVNTYLDNLRDAIDPTTGRVHASFHQTGAATGRLSSSDPNLQNIPIRTDVGRQIRKAFIAGVGQSLISADYSQIELRILAHLSEDANLLAAFEQGMDIHTAVAAQVFNVEPSQVTRDQRSHAKTINFGIIYGVTPYGLARRIEGLDVAGAKTLINDYRARFSGIDRFLDQCVEHARQHGYVSTILGRQRAIPQIDSRNPNLRALGQRLAINSVVQGSAADLIKLAMVRLHSRIDHENLPMRMLLQIHDELVLEAPDEHAQAMSQIVIEEMTHAMTLRVPLEVEAGIGKDWFNTK